MKNKNFYKKNRLTIWTVVGITGMIFGTILAVKKTPEAVEKIDEAKKERRNELQKEAKEKVEPDTPVCSIRTDEIQLSKKDIFKAVWKIYAIPAAIELGSAALLFVNSRKGDKREWSLIGMYNFAELSGRKLKEAINTEASEEEKKKIIEKYEKEMPKEVVNQINPNEIKRSVVYNGADGKDIFIEPITQQMFYSSRAEISQIIGELNRDIIETDYVSLNDFLDAFGLKESSIGDDVGWNSTLTGVIEYDFSPQYDDGFGRYINLIDISVAPRYDYSSFA